MKKFTVLLLCLCFLAFYGCAGKLMPIQPQVEKISEPPINQEVTKGIGEELLIKGTVANVQALELFKDTPNGEAKAGIYKLIGTVKRVDYGSQDSNGVSSPSKEYLDEVYNPVIESGAYIGGVIAWGIPDTWMVLIKDNVTGNISTGHVPPQNNTIYPQRRGIAKTGDYRIAQTALKANDNFQQGLIYTGKQGDIVKFLYREFKNDMARPAFNVEVIYDLKDGNEIAFKSARLKIIKATNSSITYIVLKNFE